MALSASIRTRLRHQQETISELITGFSETQLKQRVNPDKWSAFEHVAHLAAYQPVFIGRLEKIGDGKVTPRSGVHRNESGAGKEPPVFERYVAERDPLFPGYLEKTVPALLADIARDRARINALLVGVEVEVMSGGVPARANGLDGIDLRLTGRHPKYGLLTTVQWTEFFLLHEAHHLFTLFMVLQDLRSTEVIDLHG